MFEEKPKKKLIKPKLTPEEKFLKNQSIQQGMMTKARNR